MDVQSSERVDRKPSNEAVAGQMGGREAIQHRAKVQARGQETVQDAGAGLAGGRGAVSNSGTGQAGNHDKERNLGLLQTYDLLRLTLDLLWLRRPGFGGW